MQIGYARVSTGDQDTAVPAASLKTAGCGASASIGRRRPVDVGTGLNFTGCLTNFARVMCS